MAFGFNAVKANLLFIPFSIIMFRNTDVRHKRMYGCRKKRSNTGTFFDNHYKIESRLRKKCVRDRRRFSEKIKI